MNYSDLAKQLGSRGGKKTLEKYGKDHFIRIRQLGVEAKKRKKETDSILPVDNRLTIS
jgi:hypothetical protein